LCRSALTFAERFKIMQTKITKTIRVSIDVKQHLDEMKGSVSASEFIETMLSYFERNGVDPRTSINGKFKTLELQGIERKICDRLREAYSVM
jgi:predicted CopG family antitoxin